MRSRLSSRNLRRRAAALLPLAGLLLLSATSRAQVTLVPRVSVSETLTDNVGLSSSARQSEQVTEVSPGLQLTSTSGRLKTYFDYALTELIYAQNSSPSRRQHALTTFGTLEAVDNWAYLDFSGVISQQAVSAFGTPTLSNVALNSNQSEVSSYQISPYVRGRLGDMASYEARYSRAITQSSAAAGLGASETNGVVSLQGDSAFTNLGWSASANQQTSNYSAGRSTVSDRLNLGLSYALTSQFRVFVNGGREATNYTSLDKQSVTTRGTGFSWALSEVTRLSASAERRAFGNGHNLSFDHRTARTAWRFSDSQDVATTPSQQGLVSQGTVYDIFYSQFATLVPDPLARAQFVTAYMQLRNIDPNTIAVSSFLTSAVTLQRRQDLSLALLGVRDTLTLIATQSASRRLDTVSSGVDDLSTATLLRQRGFSANLAHRLTPETSLGLLVSQQNTSSDGALQATKLKFLNLSLSTRIGARTTASVGVRRVTYRGTTSYGETAVTANVTLQF